MEDEEQLGCSKGIHRIKDHLLFSTLSLLAKIIKECQVIKNPSRQQDMVNIWGKKLIPTDYAAISRGIIRCYSARLSSIIVFLSIQQIVIFDKLIKQVSSYNVLTNEHRGVY